MKHTQVSNMKVIIKVVNRIRMKVIKLVLKGFLLNRYIKLVDDRNETVPNERALEYSFLFNSLLKKDVSTVLDVGTGVTALPSLLETCGFKTTAIDNIEDYWGGGMFNTHYHVINDNILNTKLKGTFDAITCISVLEHIYDHDTAISTMLSLLNPGGRLVLTFPYNENTYINNVYEKEGASWGDHVKYIAQVFSRKNIDKWLEDNNGFKIIKQEYWQNYTGEFHVFGDFIYPPKKSSTEEKHQLTCILIEKDL